MQKNTTRILVVEDIVQDYELITDQLERAGMRCDTAKLETEEELSMLFNERQPESVLQDQSHNRWDSLAMLKWMSERDPKMPFVVVTGSMWENALIWSREQGSDECVLKGRLTDLVSAVQHATRLSEERRRRREAERELKQLRAEVETLRNWHKIPNPLPVCAGCKKVKEDDGVWTKIEHFFHKRLGISFTHGMCPVCIEKYFSEIEGEAKEQAMSEPSTS
ncbi:MAG: response regulator [Nibricoccus sp.]